MKETFERVEGEKPIGGYVPVKVRELFLVWWCYEVGLIEFRDVRVWFALREIVVRHTTRALRKPRFRIEEIMELTSQSRRAVVRASLKRLEQCGLAVCRQSSIAFGNGKGICESSEFVRRFNLIANRRRTVPVPRYAVCMIARKSRATLVATTLGHFIRLMYLRNGRCRADGCCKASWIAEVFSLDISSVKRARATLIAQGLIRTQETPQWYRNRFGWRGAVNLQWKGVDNRSNHFGRRCGKLPPRARKRRRTATAKRKPESLFETKTPICKAVHGFQKWGGKERSELHVDDLHDAKRTEAVFEQAARGGLVSRYDRLNVFAAAEKAKRVGTRNPVGLFCWLLKSRRWDYISLTDQDAGLARLRELDACGRYPGAPMLKHVLSRAGIHATSVTQPQDQRRMPRAADVLERCVTAQDAVATLRSQPVGCRA